MSDVEINTKELSRRHRTNVPRLIYGWKKGLSDLELSRRTGINVATLQRIRSDIEFSHRRERSARKMASLQGEQSLAQRHILLKPLL